MKNITCIEDLRDIARRKVPRAFFDYTEAGSYAQETLRANREDMQRLLPVAVLPWLDWRHQQVFVKLS